MEERRKFRKIFSPPAPEVEYIFKAIVFALRHIGLDWNPRLDTEDGLVVLALFVSYLGDKRVFGNIFRRPVLRDLGFPKKLYDPPAYHIKRFLLSAIVRYHKHAWFNPVADNVHGVLYVRTRYMGQISFHVLREHMPEFAISHKVEWVPVPMRLNAVRILIAYLEISGGLWPSRVARDEFESWYGNLARTNLETLRKAQRANPFCDTSQLGFDYGQPFDGVSIPGKFRRILDNAAEETVFVRTGRDFFGVRDQFEMDLHPKNDGQAATKRFYSRIPPHIFGEPVHTFRAHYGDEALIASPPCFGLAESGATVYPEKNNDPYHTGRVPLQLAYALLSSPTHATACDEWRP